MDDSSIRFKTFIGVDLHKCTVTLAAVDACGELVSRLKTDTKCVRERAAEPFLTSGLG